MASDASFAQFVVDQIGGAGTITTRFMFGEFAVYCNEKVVALICDNKLYVKPTEAGRAYIGTPVEAPAYTGAKPSFLIEEQLEDAKWLTELIRITEREVGVPPVKKNAKKGEDKDAKKAAPAAPKPATKTQSKAKEKRKVKATPNGKTASRAKPAPRRKPKTKTPASKKISKKAARPKAHAKAAKKVVKKK